MIGEFRGRYRFLSNFYPCTIVYHERTFRSTEAAYQAAKFPSEAYGEFEVATASEAKKAGHGVEPPGWKERSLQVMLDVLRIKFAKEPLRTMLLETGEEELVEGNLWHDNFYGVCHCVAGCPPERRAPGQNHLGKLLMQVRNELRQEIQQKI